MKRHMLNILLFQVTSVIRFQRQTMNTRRIFSMEATRQEKKEMLDEKKGKEIDLKFLLTSWDPFLS